MGAQPSSLGRLGHKARYYLVLSHEVLLQLDDLVEDCICITEGCLCSLVSCGGEQILADYHDRQEEEL